MVSNVRHLYLPFGCITMPISLNNAFVQYCKNPACSLKSVQRNTYSYMIECLIPCTIIIGHFHGAFCLCVKTSLCVKPFINSGKCVSPTGSFSCKSDSFYMKGFAWGLILRHKVTRKWHIQLSNNRYICYDFLHIPCKLRYQSSWGT